MKSNDWKSRLGMVYSTNPDYQFVTDDELPRQETKPKDKQKLHVRISTAGRKGKVVTLVQGFVGTDEDLKTLAQDLKRHLVLGGSVKDGEIVLQGDVREKTVALLLKMGYTGTKQV